MLQPWYFPTRHASLVAACLLLMHATIPTPAYAADDATCRELAHRFDIIKLGVVSYQRNSVLFSAVDIGCQELARTLLDTGASLEARDLLGATPLAHAARTGQRAMTELLLAKGAHIDSRDISGATALYLATENQRKATVALLLANGADPNIPGRSGVTPLAAAALKGNDRIVEELLSRGADPNVIDAHGQAALTYAAAHGFPEVVRRLLDAGVHINSRYGHGLTALMWAAGYEADVGTRAAESVIDLLLARCAHLDAADDRGRTALMVAAKLGHVEVVEMLIDRGANPRMRDTDGSTAFDLAANDDVRQILTNRSRP